MCNVAQSAYEFKFSRAHNWQNSVNVQVSLFYCGLAEFTAGACFTLNQCQTPFVDCWSVLYVHPKPDTFC